MNKTSLKIRSVINSIGYGHAPNKLKGFWKKYSSKVKRKYHKNLVRKEVNGNDSL